MGDAADGHRRRPDGPTRADAAAADVDGLAEMFEKTLLQASILDSLDDGGRRGLRATTVQEQLRDGSGAATVDDESRLEKRPRTSSRNEELRLSGSTTEKRTEDMERKAIRRETEKNYVTKWEKARVENYKFQFRAKELEQQKKIADLQIKQRTAKIVDAENAKYLNYSINELEKQIKYWENKYKTDTMEINEKLKNLETTLKEKTMQVETLKETYDERQAIIDEHTMNKQKLEAEKKIYQLRERMAVRIQAWWRGTMVRRRIGPYKHLLGPRKKSIKKSMTSKGNKTKIK